MYSPFFYTQELKDCDLKGRAGDTEPQFIFPLEVAEIYPFGGTLLLEKAKFLAEKIYKQVGRFLILEIHSFFLDLSPCSFC